MLIYFGDRHAVNTMIIDILQYHLLGGKLTPSQNQDKLLGLTRTLRSCDGRCCRVLIYVHDPLQVCTWPTERSQSAITAAQKTEIKLLVPRNLHVLYGKHRDYLPIFPFMKERALGYFL